MSVEIIKLLKEENGILKEQIQVLHKRIEALEEQIKKLATKKTSKNSSNPPSQDKGGIKRTRSLRERSGRASGGQRGHEGSTLECTVNPDFVVAHNPEHCEKCGNELLSKSGVETSHYQTIDIPEIKPIFTEHQAFEKVCSCGHCNRESLPYQGVIVYGPRIKALISYYSIEQYMPYARIAHTLKVVYGIKISEGSIDNILKTMGDQATSLYEEIRKEVEKSGVIGSDETGFRVNGKLHWVWTWQTKDVTFLHVNETRAGAVVEENFPEGFANSMLVHDRLAAQINSSAGGHQFCMAHILRELKYIQELAPENHWVFKLESLLKETIHLEKELWDNLSERKLMVADAEIAFDKLLEYPVYGEVAQRLQKSLIKHRDKLWHYIEDPEVPATNNASERALRNVKVKQKVSTSMRTLLGAKIFCKLRSIADTCKKQGTSFFEALLLLSAQSIPG